MFMDWKSDILFPPYRESLFPAISLFKYIFSTGKDKQIIRRGSDSLSYKISPLNSSQEAMHFEKISPKKRLTGI